MIQAQLSISFISFKNISCIPIFSSIFLTLYNHEAIKLKNSFFVYLVVKAWCLVQLGRRFEMPSEKSEQINKKQTREERINYMSEPYYNTYNERKAQNKNQRKVQKIQKEVNIGKKTNKCPNRFK